MVVNGAALFNQRVHIGNGHPEPDRPLGQHFTHRQLVEVERIIVVDRTPQQPREVANAGIHLLTRASHIGQLRLYPVRKLGLQPALGHGVNGDANQVGTLVGRVGRASVG